MQLMINSLWVALGGALGTLARYLFSQISINLQYPIHTLLINLIGATCIGFLSQYFSQHSSLAPQLQLLFVTGICGGFTTFSTFSLETVRLLQQGRYLAAGSYMLISCFGALFGVLLGMSIGIKR